MADNKQDNEEKDVWVVYAAIILVIIIIIGVLVSLAQGAIAFLQDGGGTWLLVVGGFLLFIFLVRGATRNH